jgi:hypothetical protein
MSDVYVYQLKPGLLILPRTLPPGRASAKSSNFPANASAAREKLSVVYLCEFDPPVISNTNLPPPHVPPPDLPVIQRLGVPPGVWLEICLWDDHGEEAEEQGQRNDEEEDGDWAS